MKISFSQAISFSLLYKAWQASAGLITIPIVVHNLDPAIQGYYYTFLSLIALQSFFELGFSIVISIYASHEWHKLRLVSGGEVSGDINALSRLVSLGQFVFKYFGFASVAYLIIAGTVGLYVLGKGQGADISWVGPWVLHVVFSAATLWLMPGLSLLEGCNQVASVAKFRLVQSLISNAALWLSLSAGYQLWSLPIFGCFGLAMLIGFICFRKKNFFKMFLYRPVSETLSWKKDLFPMQWRLAVQGLFSYLSFPLYTILVYYYFGAIEAGRMGMTLQIVAGIQTFSLVFLIARAPEFALLVASRKHSALVYRCKSAAYQSLGVMTFFCILIGIAILAATEFRLQQASRVLDAGVFAVFSTGVIISGAVQVVAVYLRAHKKELLTTVGVISGLLYGVSAWFMCVQFGSQGIAISYAMTSGFVVLPLSLIVLKSNYGRLQDYLA